MIIKRSQAIHRQKNDVDMWIYPNPEDFSSAAIVYQETKKGHSEEVYHEKSAFIYYVIEGKGTWVIDGQEHEVESADTVIILPGQKFYYTGDLKQICITAPAWDPNYEHHVRYIIT